MTDKPIPLAVIALVFFLGLTGCGSEPSEVSTPSAASSPPPTTTPSSTTPPPGPPQINWDHVLLSGIPTTVSSAVQDGQLSFEPVRPAQPEPAYVEVTDPTVVADPAHRGVAYYYDIAGIGRVVLTESPATSSPEDLRAIADARRDSGEYSILEVDGTPVLLIAANGIGRVRTIRGGIAFDITGPAISPEDVVKFYRSIRQG